jgi:hypothetical protein
VVQELPGKVRAAAVSALNLNDEHHPALTGRYKKRQGQISVLHPAVKAADEGMRQQEFVRTCLFVTKPWRQD